MDQQIDDLICFDLLPVVDLHVVCDLMGDLVLPGIGCGKLYV